MASYDARHAALEIAAKTHGTVEHFDGMVDKTPGGVSELLVLRKPNDPAAVREAADVYLQFLDPTLIEERTTGTGGLHRDVNPEYERLDREMERATAERAPFVRQDGVTVAAAQRANEKLPPSTIGDLFTSTDQELRLHYPGMDGREREHVAACIALRHVRDTEQF